MDWRRFVAVSVATAIVSVPVALALVITGAPDWVVYLVGATLITACGMQLVVPGAGVQFGRRRRDTTLR